MKILWASVLASLFGCTSAPQAPPPQVKLSHDGTYHVDGFADETGLHFWCKKGNVVLKACEGEAAPCAEFCDASAAAADAAPPAVGGR